MLASALARPFFLFLFPRLCCARLFLFAPLPFPLGNGVPAPAPAIPLPRHFGVATRIARGRFFSMAVAACIGFIAWFVVTTGGDCCATLRAGRARDQRRRRTLGVIGGKGERWTAGGTEGEEEEEGQARTR